MWQSVKTTSDFGCVLLWLVIDEIPVSQMQQNILVVATAQKFQAKAPSDSACDESFPGLQSWLIHGHRQNRCGIAPWRESVTGHKENP